MKRKKKLVAKCMQPGFVYTPAVATNVGLTFARIREQLAKADEANAKNMAAAIPLGKKKAA